MSSEVSEPTVWRADPTEIGIRISACGSVEELNRLYHMCKVVWTPSNTEAAKTKKAELLAREARSASTPF